MNAETFRKALAELLATATNKGDRSLTVTSGVLHSKVGGYPGPNHRMPMCCDAMYGAIKEGDQVIERPPKGKGATLKIRYLLPR